MDLGEVAKAGTGYDAVDSGRAVLEQGRRRISREGEILAGGAIIMAGAFIYPYAQGLLDHITPGCLFHRITGLPCLLCGMTRSLVATAHGHLGEAFQLHLLGPPLFAAIAVVTLVLSMEFAFGRPILPRVSRRGWVLLGWGTLGLLVTAWVARLAFFGINV
jgi:hypothetical protein